MPAVRGAVAEEFIQRLEAGQFRQVRDAKEWIKKRTRKTPSASGTLKVLRRLSGKLKMPRKSHAKKDPAKAAKFKAELPAGSRGSGTGATGAPVGAGRASLRAAAGDPPRLGAAGRAGTCALRYAVSMGLPPPGPEGRRSACHRTAVHPGHRPRHPRPFPLADSRRALRRLDQGGGRQPALPEFTPARRSYHRRHPTLSTPAAVTGLMPGWLKDQVNGGALP